MKVLLTHAIMPAILGLAGVVSADADVAYYHAVDQNLSAVSQQARNLRWDIAAVPIREVDRRAWLRGMDDVCDEITDLQKSVLRGRTQAHLCREVDDLSDEIHDLHEDVVRRGTPASYRYERGINGARFRCGILPNGCVIPSTFVSRLEALDQTVHALHALVAGDASAARVSNNQPFLDLGVYAQPPLPGVVEQSSPNLTSWETSSRRLTRGTERASVDRSSRYRSRN